jgi:hypothetical protein
VKAVKKPTRPRDTRDARDTRQTPLPVWECPDDAVVFDHVPLKLEAYPDRFLPLAEGSGFDNKDGCTVGSLQGGIQMKMEALVQRATKGERDAVEALASITRRAVATLTWLAYHHKDILADTASRASEWPVLYSRHPDDLRQANDLLKRLAVGTQADKNKAGSRLRWTRRKVATLYAEALLTCIRKNQQQMKALLHPLTMTKPEGSRLYELKRIRASLPASVQKWARQSVKLPAFSKSTVSRYWLVARAALMEATGGHPERVSQLRSLGEYRTKEQRGESRFGAVPAGTREANIREGIFKAIKQALTSLARKEVVPLDKPAS